MARQVSQLWYRFPQNLATRLWAARAREIETASLVSLRDEVTQARTLARHLDKIIRVAEARLALPRVGNTTTGLPPGTDWSYRPDLWRLPLSRRGSVASAERTRIGENAVLYHNCPMGEVALRQIRNTDQSDLAAFGISLEVFGFEGSFLSLALDLPTSANKGLHKRHIFRAEIIAEAERPTEMFARLNIRHGPNTEQIAQAIMPKDRIVEFDLGHTDLNEKRVSGLWLDIIIDRPVMNRIVLRDVTVARYPRAEF